MPKYRKKPVVIDAVQFLGTQKSMEDIMGFISPAYLNRIGYSQQTNELEVYIDTLEGQMAGSLGDYIIRGVKGEYYPCKPDIFEATYEAVTYDEQRDTAFGR